MRELSCTLLQKAVTELCLSANQQIAPDIRAAIKTALEKETAPAASYALEQITENYACAEEDGLPICQDTGMAVIFADVGQEVHWTDGQFEAAIQAGVRDAYEKGYLRKSVVSDPLFDRKNTLDNCPAIIHTAIVPGDRAHLLVIAKGFGSENMSRIGMLTPSAGEAGVFDFIVETARLAGPNPCPPIIVGVGVGGDFEQAALLAKRATARPLSERHPDPRYAALEKRALDAINALGIGAAGYGGLTTALNVAINYAPTHIAGLPVAVNICCHASRHAETTL